ncbi:MAG: hypothetical protein V2A79_00300 [Planctomycetota bacterium]
MSSPDRGQALEAMRQAVLDQAYVLTLHALLEMYNDGCVTAWAGRWCRVIMGATESSKA